MAVKKEKTETEHLILTWDESFTGPGGRRFEIGEEACAFSTETNDPELALTVYADGKVVWEMGLTEEEEHALYMMLSRREDARFIKKFEGR